jgi:hypothetical protein
MLTVIVVVAMVGSAWVMLIERDDSKVGTASKESVEAAGESIDMGPRFEQAVRSYGCTVAAEAYRCLQAALNRKLDQQGFAAALEQVEQLEAQVAPEPFACHPLVHGLGRRMVEQFGLNSVENSLRASSVCSSGFIHGTFEAVGLLLSGEKLRSFLYDTCSVVRDDTIWADCTHSAGHALAIAAPRDVNEAIQGCEWFDPQSDDCARGVTMAYSIGSPKFSELHDPDWDPSWGWLGFEPSQLNGACLGFRESWQVLCWEFIWNGYYLHKDQVSVADYFDNCPKRGERNRDLCVSNGARLLMYLEPDWRTAVDQCADLSGERGNCLHGTALFAELVEIQLGTPRDQRENLCAGSSWTEAEVRDCERGVAEARNGERPNLP